MSAPDGAGTLDRSGFRADDGLDELSRPHAARARPHAAGDAADHRPDFLEVQMPLPVRHVVGVADPVTGHWDLSAELTVLSHCFPSVATRDPKKRCILPSARPERNPSGRKTEHLLPSPESS